MIIEYYMPKLAMAMNEGTINEWLVEDGAKIESGEPIAVVETEKVAYDCESPESGYFLRIVPEGETVDVEVLIGCFCESAEELEAARARFLDGGPAVAAAAASSAAERRMAAPDDASVSLPERSDCARGRLSAIKGRISASPVARKIARTNGIDLKLVNGTGPGGRIVKRDVLAFEAPQPHAADEDGVLARIPLKGLRGTIAQRMTRSLGEAAQVSGHFESDITRLLEIRGRFVDRAEALGGRVSVNAFLIRAITSAITRVPQVNACLEGDEVLVHRHVNLGIATSLPGGSELESGLIVAVLKRVERMGVMEIDREMKALLNRVREGKATPADLTGSTITLSSTAGIGPPGLTSTPVLNLPNVFMIGPSTPVERVIPVNGEPKVRTLLPVSYTFDHRAIDGEPTARFLAALDEVLSEPELMLA